MLILFCDVFTNAKYFNKLCFFTTNSLNQLRQTSCAICAIAHTRNYFRWIFMQQMLIIFGCNVVFRLFVGQCFNCTYAWSIIVRKSCTWFRYENVFGESVWKFLVVIGRLLRLFEGMCAIMVAIASNPKIWNKFGMEIARHWNEYFYHLRTRFTSFREPFTNQFSHSTLTNVWLRNLHELLHTKMKKKKECC